MNLDFKDVSYTYQPNTPLENRALEDINLSIRKGSFTCVAGRTGSGKSTMVQLINGLLRPTQGEIVAGDFSLTQGKNKSIKELRKQVAMVFQYPEHQLFEETVKKELIFGPKNFGIKVTDSQIEQVVKAVGLSSELLDRSPFELSGGQKRRVAIASALILDPSVLILDEPTAGLDPTGQRQLMDLFQILQSQGKTIIMITHHMEHVLRAADQLIIFDQGRIAVQGKPIEVFSDQEVLRKSGLQPPDEFLFLDELKKQFDIDIPYKGQTLDELVSEVVKAIKLRDLS
ncbi:energy-coupling factor transporter ATPase [Piscibacillus salipiscarius]|uniref:Energy-coupling factor transporter ATP-binding protein EcfA2 n=1 Tax=Piscibacillus salipiscarius TaxID=299480 RepID=A0ABW5QDL8_9BACI|nr:energy-coupling factor transporter ATPase [Piscibacillus salipiscarius]